MNRSDRILLGVCFFVSGATALVYQVLWSRHLKLFFGSTTEAVSVVLAVFMAGLGLGAHLLGRRIDRSKNPAFIYGALEFGIGIYALLTTPLLAMIREIYAVSARSLGDPGLFSSALKIPLSAAALFLPAFAMGATLPALLRAISDTSKRARSLVGVYYAINTLGAVAGVLAEAFVLVENLGLVRTMQVAALVNLVLGGGVMLWSRGKAGARAGEGGGARLADALRGVSTSREGRFVIWGLFVSGLVTMVTEIVFFRVLGLVFGVFNHAFSIVLAVFLLGLAIGSLLTASAERAGSSRIQVFAAVYMGLAVLVLLVQATMTRLPRLVLYMRQIPGLDYGDVLIGKALLACLFLLPFAIVAGMGVPLLLAHLSGDLDHLAGTVGAAYLVNTVGTVFGSLLAGFVLIPAIGTEDSLLTMAVICVLTGAAGLFIASSPRLRLLSFGLAALVCVAVIGLPKWPAALFLNSDTQGRGTVMTTRLAIEEQLTASPREILFFKEGRNATVAVTRRAETRSLFIGGHPDASDQPDMATQTFLGIVPQVVRPAAEEVLVVGFGSGVTAGTLLKNPSVKRLDVIEMERAVVEASPLFHHVNGAPEEDPRFHVIFEDARSYVVSSPRQYDLMVSEPSNPWRAGIANVFTLDFFLESKQLLKKQGVFAQWLQLYSLDFDSVRLVLRTFHQAFPHVEVWWLDPFDLVILGSESEMKTEPKAFEQLLARHYAEEARRYGGIRKPGEFFSRYLMGTEAVRKVAGEAGPIHRDAFPVLEFEAPRGLFTADSQNHRRILAAKTAHGGWLPPSVRGQVPEGVAWLGFGAMLRSAGLWTEARDAFLRAAESGEPHRGLVFAAEVALDGKDIGPASRYLDQLSAMAGPIPSDVQQEVALTRADVASRLGKPEAALELLASSPMKTVAVERERLRLLAQLGRVDEAEVLARELLQSAALGKENGAEAVRDTYGYLVQIASSREVAQRLLPLVEKLPPASAGFAEVPRLETLASLYARAGRPQEAFQAAERISDMGILSLRALLLKAALLERAGDPTEAMALREQVRILAPASVTDAVPVPLPAREKPGEGSVR